MTGIKGGSSDDVITGGRRGRHLSRGEAMRMTIRCIYTAGAGDDK